MNKERWKIYFVIIFISFCQGLQYTISPVLRQIQDQYSTVNVSTIQMLVAVPAFLAMFIAVAAGWLVIKIDMRKLLIFGCFMTGVTGFIPFLYNSFTVLFLSRTLLGVGHGLIMALNTTVVADNFEGQERISAMGIQGASVGVGMMLSMVLGGLLGFQNYQNVYYIHVIGLLAAFIVWKYLPYKSSATKDQPKKIELNRKVFYISFLVLFEFVFLISISTNMAMHLSGKLTGNSSVAGFLTGIYSGVQIVIGPLLGQIARRTKRNTLAVFMVIFSIGAIILALFPSSLAMLMIGCVFCGISQGVFVPYVLCVVSEAVKPIAVTMASACITVAICVGELISPPILNGLSKLLYGGITTTHVFTIGAGMVLLMSLIVAVKENKTS